MTSLEETESLRLQDLDLDQVKKHIGSVWSHLPEEKKEDLKIYLKIEDWVPYAQRKIILINILNDWKPKQKQTRERDPR